MKEPKHGQIAYNCCLSNAFKLKLGNNVKIFFTEMRRATGEESAEYVIRLAKEIPTSHVNARYAQLLFIIHRLW